MWQGDQIHVHNGNVYQIEWFFYLSLFQLMRCITNFIGYDLAIIGMWNLLFIGSYGIDTNVIHLFVLFEHWSHAHFDTNVICQFVFFIHWSCMFICVVYIWKLCTWQLPCLNNAQQSCLNSMNPWNNRFHMDLERTHEACKFVMWRHNFPFWSCLKCKWGRQWFAFEFWWFFLQKWLLLNIFI